MGLVINQVQCSDHSWQGEISDMNLVENHPQTIFIKLQVDQARCFWQNAPAKNDYKPYFIQHSVISSSIESAINAHWSLLLYISLTITIGPCNLTKIATYV